MGTTDNLVDPYEVPSMVIHACSEEKTQSCCVKNEPDPPAPQPVMPHGARSSSLFLHEQLCHVSYSSSTDRVYSDSFTVDCVTGDSKTSTRSELRLLLFPNGQKESREHCSVYLQLRSASTRYVFLNYRVTLLPSSSSSSSSASSSLPSEAAGWNKYEVDDDYGWKKFCLLSVLRGLGKHEAVFKVEVEISAAPEREASFHGEHSVSLCPDWRCLRPRQAEVGFPVPLWVLHRLPINSVFPFVYQKSSGCCGDASMLNIALSLSCTSVNARTTQRKQSQMMTEVRDKLTQVLRDSETLAHWRLSIWHASRGYSEFVNWIQKSNTLDTRLIINYKRCVGLGDYGHFGVVVGYVPPEWLVANDSFQPQGGMACLFDPNPSYGLQLVPLKLLWEAVNTIDPDSKVHRGFVVLEREHT